MKDVDHEEQVLSLQRVALAKEAELKSVLFVLRKANDLGPSKIHIFSDNAQVVEGIIGAKDKAIKGIISDIHAASSTFSSIEFSFIPRHLFSSAHFLAKLSFTFFWKVIL
ncbi:hypothetical protein AAC387_Pa01g3273 [Persea americana]